MSTTNGVRAQLNQRSRTLVHGAERAGARAMLKAVGYSDDDLAKPLIGVANTGPKSAPATSTCASWLTMSSAASAPPAAHPSSSTPSASRTVSPWAPRA